MNIETAQAELRRAYLRGGPGAIVSAIVWLAAAFAASEFGVGRGFAVLFFGGMLIFPVATIIVRVLLRRPPVSKDNPGGLTVIEAIFPMIGGLLTAWLFVPYRSEFVFPLAAFAVGAHYFGFRSAYGDWTNWALGATMCVVGVASIIFGLPNANLVPYIIGGIELVFGCWFISNSISKDRPST